LGKKGIVLHMRRETRKKEEPGLKKRLSKAKKERERKVLINKGMGGRGGAGGKRDLLKPIKKKLGVK